MRKIEQHELKLISGALDLIIKQQFSVDGISQKCINALLFPDFNNEALWELSLLTNCSGIDFLLLDDRLDNADTISIVLA